MINDDFEWDKAKAADNYARHGVSFGTPNRVFDDLFAIERLDDREDYGEDRYNGTIRALSAAIDRVRQAGMLTPSQSTGRA